MAYIPDVNQITEPVSGRPAGTAAAEFRGIKALLATLAIAGLAGPTVRQAIQSASLDSNGQNNAITVGAGLRPGLLATANAYHLSYAAGFNSGKPSNLDESVVADVADILVANLPLSNTSYLHKIYAGAYGSTLVPKQEGYAFDRSKQALLNFDGINGAITTTDDAGNAWAFVGNAQLDTGTKKFGLSALKLDGVGDEITSASFTTFGDGSWEYSCWFNLNLTSGVHPLITAETGGAFQPFSLAIDHNAGSRRTSIRMSSDGATNNIANGTLGGTALALATWYRVRIAFDALGGSYKIYLSNNGAAETLETTIASALRICAFTSTRIGRATGGGFTDFNGWVDALRLLPCVTNTSLEVPSVVAPTITDYLITFFSIPQMKMYDVTAASAAGGVNPTLTAVNRLFIGEADTNAVAVTAVRNYAVRGQYMSSLTALSGATTIFNANIGTRLVNARLKLVNQVTQAGYSPGDEADMVYSRRGGVSWSSNNFKIQRNTVAYVPQNNGAEPFILNDSGTNDVVILTLANWKMRLEVERAW